MRYTTALLDLALVLLAAVSGAGTVLSDEELDQVSARGVGGFTESVVPTIATIYVPVVVMNTSINYTTVIDMPINVNTTFGICSYCPGGTGPTVIASNPINKDLVVSAPQITTIPTTVSVPTVLSPSVGNPSFDFTHLIKTQFP